MEKKVYNQPRVVLVQLNTYCMLGNQSGEGEGASLDLKFEEETEFPDEE
ncbi:MAG: hypothetical protein J5905_02330 [Prevotella sp.]|nr:hypothetical protein [Prevotella sp.]